MSRLLRSLWSTVSALPDYLLLSQTRQLARHEQALQILVLDHLREIETRGLHLTGGYGSLFDYVVHELGYTAAASLAADQGDAAVQCYQRGAGVAAGRQAEPEATRRNCRTCSSAATAATGGAVRRGQSGKSVAVRAGRRGITAHQENQHRRLRRLPTAGDDPAPGAGPVLDDAAREELVQRAAGKSTREVQQMVAEVDPELAQRSDRLRATRQAGAGS